MARGSEGTNVDWCCLVLVVIVVVSLSISLNPLSSTRTVGVASTRTGTASSGSAASGAILPNLTDGGTVSEVIGGSTVVLSDAITLGLGSPSERTYTVTVTTSHREPSVLVNLTTRPAAEWARAGQFPDGPSVLPGLSKWAWNVESSSRSDTGNWSVSSPYIYRAAAWVNATFTVTGAPDFRVPVTVNVDTYSGARSTGVGFVQAQQIPSSTYSTTLSLARTVDPTLVRWSQTYDSPATWHNTTQTVSFDFNEFAPLMNFSRSLGAQSLISLPAGTWGDGNLLPSGMPLNTSLLVNWYGHSTGYYPSASAYRTYVTTFAKDLKANGWTITYWNIGNEVPIWISMAYARAFATVFNAGSEAIHSVFPKALVGSDVITAPGKLEYFATTLQGVGFLGFHFYPASRLCPVSGTFCIPDGQNGYLTDAGILAATRNLSQSWEFAPPYLSQLEWFNYTGTWLPILDEESNLNSAQALGSDPRQQTLFDAAWLTWLYMTASSQNVSAVTSYSLLSAYPLQNSTTLAYGGWGFGLASEPTTRSVVRYAPYWAARLWGSNVPSASQELVVTTRNSWCVPAYAVRNGSGVNVVVVNLANVDTTIPVSVLGGSYRSITVWTLDQRSFSMYFDTPGNTEKLTASGLSVAHLSGRNPATVTLEGYGVAVLSFS